MIHPTINDLSKGQYNRYEIALATAKCARMITNEYTRQRQEAERQQTGNKETDKPLNAMIDKEVRDEKAVKLAIGRIYSGEYTIVHKDPAEQEKEELAILAGLNSRYNNDDRLSDEDDSDAAESVGDVAEEDISDEEITDDDRYDRYDRYDGYDRDDFVDGDESADTDDAADGDIADAEPSDEADIAE